LYYTDTIVKIEVAVITELKSKINRIIEVETPQLTAMSWLAFRLLLFIRAKGVLKSGPCDAWDLGSHEFLEPAQERT
jgi:hypothetical protein